MVRAVQELHMYSSGQSMLSDQHVCSDTSEHSNMPNMSNGLQITTKHWQMLSWLRTDRKYPKRVQRKEPWLSNTGTNHHERKMCLSEETQDDRMCRSVWLIGESYVGKRHFLSTMYLLSTERREEVQRDTEMWERYLGTYDVLWNRNLFLPKNKMRFKLQHKPGSRWRWDDDEKILAEINWRYAGYGWWYCSTTTKKSS